MAWRHEALLLPWVIVSVLIAPAETVSPCRDTDIRWTGWCQGNGTCQTYPLKHGSDGHSNCNKTCNICQSDTLCGDGYYGPECKPCVSRCQGGQCETARPTECQQTCPDEYHGFKCDKRCPWNCVACDRWSDDCTECKHGQYGSSCSISCPVYCLDEVCDTQGKCEHGCVKSFFGPKCNQTCPDDNCLMCERDSGQCLECKPTWYGSTCDLSCPNCAEGNCSRKTGECREGCLAGFHGNKCDIKCNPYCKMRDSNKLVYCKQDKGTCLDGCSGGHYGDTCEQLCSDTCNGHVCNQTTGRCNYGCQSGTYGDFCKQNCSDRCGKEGDVQCHQTDGSCAGCQRGWYGPYCTDACPDGCRDGWCHQESGVCKESCKRGFMGDRCDIACLDYRYGFNCNESCGHCKKAAPCDRFFGNCSSGCADGFRGYLCAQPLVTDEPGADATLPIVLTAVAISLIILIVITGFLIHKKFMLCMMPNEKKVLFPITEPTQGKELPTLKV